MVKNKPIGLNPEQFANAFPFHFGFDGDLVITSLGESLRHKVSGLELGSSLHDCFHFTRPNTEISLTTFSENPKTLYVLECRTTPLVLRGQFIPTDSDGFLFLGSPWFSNIEEMAAAGLTFNDFAIHDPVVDLLQLLQAQTISLQDIQAFAKRLGKQKEKLAQANQELEARNQILQATEEQLRHQTSESQKLALVAAKTDNAVIITDAAGLTEWVNEGFTKQTGYTLNEIQGKKPGSLLQGKETDPETVEFMSKQLDQGNAFEVEILNYTKTNVPIWIQIEVQPIRDPDHQITNFIAIESNITTRKNAEHALQIAKSKAEEHSRLKSEFLATVSHEIRTPMNAVMGMTELLLESDLSSKQLGLLKTVRTSADSLLAVINDVLDLSKIESGKQDLHRESFSLRELVDNVLGSLGERCSQKNIELNALVHSEVEDWVCSDRGKLQQILLNLVGNAVKFTAKGEVRLTVQNPFHYGNTTHLEFIVTDTGVGFDESEKDKLFESFGRSDNPQACKHTGTGLGLSISKKLAELLNGTLSAKGKLNRGAEFICRIPLDRSLASEPPVLSAFARPLCVSLLGLPLSTTNALACHLTYLGIEYKTHQTEAESRRFFENSTKLSETIPVAIRDESCPTLPWSNGDKELQSVILISIGSRYEAKQGESILFKPVSFFNLLETLQAMALGRQPTNPVSDLCQAESLIPRYQHLLIAEDNAINQTLIRELLNRLHLKATLVEDGQQVLEVLKKEPFDCILMDCQMPILDGLETTKRIRQLEAESTHPQSPRTTIIAMTANALKGDRERCLEAGMDDYLSKPVRLVQLRERLLAPSSPHAAKDSRQEAPDSESISMIKDAFDTLSSELGLEAVLLLIEEFLADTPQQIQKLSMLVQQNDAANVHLEAHSIKSLALTFGMSQTGVIAKQIESAAMAGSTDQFDPLIDRLKNAYQEESGQLQATLATRGEGPSNPADAP